MVYVLPDIKGGLNVEGDSGDDAESAEADHGSAEDFTIGLAREFHQLARCGNEFQGGHSGSEVAVFLARAVSRGAAGSGDGDVGQGSQVVQSKALAIEIRAELAVGDARFESYGAGLPIHRYHLVHGLERQQVLTAVRNGVEAVARAEDFHFVLGPENGADLVDGCGLVQVVRTIGEVPGPIGQLLLIGPRGEGRNDGAGDGGGEQVEESSFVHDF